jgi:hypothetical protein
VDGEQPQLQHERVLPRSIDPTMSAPSFTNLIRFLDENSVEWYGQVASESLDNIEGSVVKVMGHDIENVRDTGMTAVVKKASGILCLNETFGGIDWL